MVPTEAETDKRIADLEAENRRLEMQRDALLLKEKVFGSIVALVLFGPRLTGSIRAWIIASTLDDPFPREEFAEVVAAILARIVRVGLVSILLAEAVLIWQNLLIHRQNIYFREQTGEIRNQIEQQQKLSDLAQRANLVRTIYGRLETCADAEDADQCPHREDIRTRAEAVVSFVEIERRLNRRIDLSGADLSSMFLPKLDLRGAKLIDTDFRWSTLDGANLEGSNLFGAIFQGASLFRACLKNSNIITANLAGAALQEANLEGAKGEGQLEKACGDAKTKLPQGRKMPSSWPNCGAGPGWEPGMGSHIRAATADGYSPVPCS